MEMFRIRVSWGKEWREFECDGSVTFLDLQKIISEHTGIDIASQKLLFKPSDKLFKSKTPDNPSLQLHHLLKPNKPQITIKLIPTTSKQPPTLSAILHPLTLYTNSHSPPISQNKIKYKGQRHYQLAPNAHITASNLITSLLSSHSLNLMNPPRDSKHLLVLDLDKTLLHFNSNLTLSNQINDQIRPYLFQFLSRMYTHFDLAIWSQTHYKYIELKLNELGLLNRAEYKFCFALNLEHMFKVKAKEVGKYEKDGKLMSVKPLHYIWMQSEGRWSKKNTLHLDDVRRNFILNPENGVVCDPYTIKRKEKDKDHLKDVADYLEYLVTIHKDVTAIDHTHWKQQLEQWRTL